MGTIHNILKHSHIGLYEAIYADMSMFPSEKVWSKKHMIFNDPQLSEYRWVYALDADLFFASKHGNKYPFFDKALNLPEQIGVTEIHRNEPYAMMDSHFFSKGADVVIEKDIDGKGERVREWIDKARELLPEDRHDILDTYKNRCLLYTSPSPRDS